MTPERIQQIKSLLLNKKTFIAVVIVGLSATLSGCIVPTLTASEIRSTLDECSGAQLENVVFMRADKTVLAVACTPAAGDIQNSVTVKHPILYAASPGHNEFTLPLQVAPADK